MSNYSLDSIKAFEILGKNTVARDLFVGYLLLDAWIGNGEGSGVREVHYLYEDSRTKPDARAVDPSRCQRSREK